jgi:hypothetical protein
MDFDNKLFLSAIKAAMFLGVMRYERTKRELTPFEEEQCLKAQELIDTTQREVIDV